MKAEQEVQTLLDESIGLGEILFQITAVLVPEHSLV